MASGPYLSLIVPCRDMAPFVERVLREYAALLDGRGRTYEIIVVPNASTDGTTEICARLCAADPRFVCVENPAGGWGLSVRMGLAQARGEVLAYTNLARTAPGELGPPLDAFEAKRPCLAKKQRVARGILKRQIGSWLYNMEGRILFGTTTMDVNGTPKVFERTLYDRVTLSENGDVLDLQFMAQVAKLGVRVVDLPTPGFKRHGGSSSTNWASAIGMLGGAWRLRLFG